MSIPNLSPEQVEALPQEELQTLYDNMTDREAEAFDVAFYAQKHSKQAIDGLIGLAQNSESERIQFMAFQAILEHAAKWRPRMVLGVAVRADGEPVEAEQSERCRWPITDQIRREVVEEAHRILSQPGTKRGDALRAAQVLAAFDKITQDDIHHAENLEQQTGMMKLKLERAEQGLPNDSVAVTVQQLPAPTVMPAPEWLKRMGLMSPNDG